MLRGGAYVGTCGVVCCAGDCVGLCWVCVFFFNIPYNFWAYCRLLSACWVAFDIFYGIMFEVSFVA